ncbi:hypothetical protein [Niabella hirudinis]|uniref:hypothetical protein n=1 Tax=Niabella hirudinis TaxID=1285929 RepID=UPI003EBB051E
MGVRSFLCFLGILMSCRSVNLGAYSSQISDVKIYQFDKTNGSSTSLSNHVYKLSQHSPSSAKVISVDLNLFRDRIAKSTVKKHFQQKIAGVRYGGNYTLGDKKHYFIYIPETTTLIDFSDMKSYVFKEPLGLE